jgi:hypothetical protein
VHFNLCLFCDSGKDKREKLTMAVEVTATEQTSEFIDLGCWPGALFRATTRTEDFMSEEKLVQNR